MVPGKCVPCGIRPCKDIHTRLLRSADAARPAGHGKLCSWRPGRASAGASGAGCGHDRCTADSCQLLQVKFKFKVRLKPTSVLIRSLRVSSSTAHKHCVALQQHGSHLCITAGHCCTCTGLAAYLAALDAWVAPVDDAIAQAQATRDAASTGTAAVATTVTAMAGHHSQLGGGDGGGMDDGEWSVRPARERYASVEARQALISDAIALLKEQPPRRAAQPEAEQTRKVQLSCCDAMPHPAAGQRCGASCACAPRVVVTVCLLNRLVTRSCALQRCSSEVATRIGAMHHQFATGAHRSHAADLVAQQR